MKLFQLLSSHKLSFGSSALASREQEFAIDRPKLRVELLGPNTIHQDKTHSHHGVYLRTYIFIL